MEHVTSSMSLSERIPAWPVAGPLEHELVGKVLDSGSWNAALGTFVTEFEEQFAAHHEADHAVAIANGTVAIMAALAVLDLPYGAEVIVPSYTFFATAAAPLALGLVPVYCDVAPGTHQMDPDHLRSLITERTGAVIPVHLAGALGEMESIRSICEEAELPMIEDAAQAAAVRFRGRPLPVGEMATFSFQSSKNIAAGEGGAIVTRDPELGARLRSYVNVGRVPGGGWYEHRNFGLNLRMTEVQGAILLAQLSRHTEQQARRQAGATYLHSLLEGVDGLALPAVMGSEGTTHGQHLFLMRVTDAVERRDQFVALMRERGLSHASSGYVPLHANEALISTRRRLCDDLGRPEPMSECPHTEQICSETAWLPQPVLLADEDVLDDVATVVRGAFADALPASGTRTA